MTTSQSTTSNLILRACDPEDFDALLPDLEPVKLAQAQVLYKTDAQIEHIDFLEGGVASIIDDRPGTPRTEVGIFGRDGVSGISCVLGVTTAIQTTLIQVGNGAASLRIARDRFLKVVEQSRNFEALLLRYLHTAMVQAANSIVSNAHHHLEARLARWLLMCHDRVDGDEMALTHEFMAVMIGAQRTGVTVTLHVLEGLGAIRSKRSRVIILDRGKLEELAGGSYGQPEAEYRRLIGAFGRSAPA